jgi:hypothetical protein
MVNPYLVGAPAAGAGALLVVKSIFKNKENNVKKGEKEQRRGTVTDDEASFACERVCASDRLLKRMGGLAKVINTTHKTPLSLSRAARGENLLPFSSSVFFRALCIHPLPTDGERSSNGIRSIVRCDPSFE